MISANQQKYFIYMKICSISSTNIQQAHYHYYFFFLSFFDCSNNVQVHCVHHSFLFILFTLNSFSGWIFGTCSFLFWFSCECNNNQWAHRIGISISISASASGITEQRDIRRHRCKTRTNGNKEKYFQTEISLCMCVVRSYFSELMTTRLRVSLHWNVIFQVLKGSHRFSSYWRWWYCNRCRRHYPVAEQHKQSSEREKETHTLNVCVYACVFAM